jgi:hypothetical protein
MSIRYALQKLFGTVSDGTPQPVHEGVVSLPYDVTPRQRPKGRVSRVIKLRLIDPVVRSFELVVHKRPTVHGIAALPRAPKPTVQVGHSGREDSETFALRNCKHTRLNGTDECWKCGRVAPTYPVPGLPR